MYGQFLVKCFHCLSDYISGDCITHMCPDCSAKGHETYPCKKCEEESQEQIEALKAEHLDRTLGPPDPQTTQKGGA